MSLSDLVALSPEVLTDITANEARARGLIRLTNWYDIREAGECRRMERVVEDALEAGKTVAVVPYTPVGRKHMLCVWQSVSPRTKPLHTSGLEENMRVFNPPTRA